MAYQKISPDVTLWYEELGPADGKPLLCCQEGFGGDRAYQQILAENGFHVFQIQIRGFGKSTHVWEDHGEAWWDIWADDAAAFADAKGFDEFYYVGTSHGAGIGWHLAYRHPGRMKAFFGIVCGPHERGGLETSAARWAVIQAARSWETWHAYVLERMGPRPEAKGDETPEELDRLEKRRAMYDEFWNRPLESSRINPKKPFNWCKTEEELAALIHTIRVPAILLGGMRDDIATPKTMLRSAGALPDAKLVLYERAGHGLCSQFPREVAEDILSFCRQRGL